MVSREQEARKLGAVAAWEARAHPPPACAAQQARRAEQAAAEAATAAAREARVAEQRAAQLAAQEDFVRRQVRGTGAARPAFCCRTKPGDCLSDLLWAVSKTDDGNAWGCWV